MSRTTPPRRTAARLLAAGSLAVTAAVYAAAPASAAAPGDSRAVSQPVLPSTCTTLTAALSAASRTFSSAQETAPPDTARIQAALNSCAGTGKAVVLAANDGADAFLAGPLTVGSGVYLVVAGGVTLFASRDAANYQVSGASSTCGTVASSSSGCKPFIYVTGSGSGIEASANAAGTRGIIDGRGDLDIYGTSTTWWALATTAKNDGLSQNNPRLIQTQGAGDFTVYDIDLVNAAKQHLYFKSGNGLTVWGLRIKTPATARNTDGIDIDSSSNATVDQSYIQDGDDGVAMETNASAESDITVENSHFYGTHGISIGSGTTYGLSSILVSGNTIQGKDSAGNTSGSDNGLRIKSDSSVGGTVSGVEFDATCMSGVKYPLDFDPFYSNGDGSHIPYFKSVTVNGAKAVSSASGATSVLKGYSSSYPLGLSLLNVSFDATSTTAGYADIGTYNTDLSPSGTGVSVKAISGSGSVPSCAFPAFPAL